MKTVEKFEPSTQVKSFLLISSVSSTFTVLWSEEPRSLLPPSEDYLCGNAGQDAVIKS